MTKRQAEEINIDNVVSFINLDKGLINGLLNLTDDELVAVLADVANMVASASMFSDVRVNCSRFGI